MSLNLPFEPVPGEPTENPPEDMFLSGGLVVLAVTVPLPAGGRHPGILFRFAAADGSGFYPPVLFAPDDPQSLRRAVPLLAQAIEAALA